MKLLIEIDLEETDHPTYTHRVNSALLQLVAKQLSGGMFTEYEFEYTETDYLEHHTSVTKVKVMEARTNENDAN